jgi:hypothetical protein
MWRHRRGEHKWLKYIENFIVSILAAFTASVLLFLQTVLVYAEITVYNYFSRLHLWVLVHYLQIEFSMLSNEDSNTTRIKNVVEKSHIPF